MGTFEKLNRIESNAKIEVDRLLMGVEYRKKSSLIALFNLLKGNVIKKKNGDMKSPFRAPVENISYSLPAAARFSPDVA